MLEDERYTRRLLSVSAKVAYALANAGNDFFLPPKNTLKNDQLRYQPRSLFLHSLIYIQLERPRLQHQTAPLWVSWPALPSSSFVSQITIKTKPWVMMSV